MWSATSFFFELAFKKRFTSSGSRTLEGRGIAEDAGVVTGAADALAVAVVEAEGNESVVGAGARAIGRIAISKGEAFRRRYFAIKAEVLKRVKE